MGVLIIAEAGVNHNGNIEIAKKMIAEAAKIRADTIKFQTYRTENLVTRSAKKAEYQQKVVAGDESQYAMLKSLELNADQHRELIGCCHENGIQFLSTAFDFDSIELLKGFSLPMWKISSGEITNLPYLIEIAKIGKPVILSTGMSTLGEVKSAVNVLKENGASDITVLHCNTEYPTPYEDVNLKAMLTMREELGVKIGYSDHTPGIEVPIAAVALGATIIEKHFTLDKTMEGPDHKASLEVAEFAAMIRAIRNIEKALGENEKLPSPSELKNITIARKSIVAKQNIQKGERLTVTNITVKRPGTGISPMKWFDVLGTTAIKDFAGDELIVL